MRSKVIVSVYLALFSIAAFVIMGCTTKGLDYQAGLSKFEAKELDEALEIFEAIAQEEGKYANRARYYIGECYKLQFKWDEATAQFQTVVDTEPPASYLATEARNKISQIREGRRDIERLKIIHDNNPGTEQAADALLELGSVYENKLEDYDNAVKAYRQLIEEFPGTPKAAQGQVNVGYTYFPCFGGRGLAPRDQ
jgi:TolA-binding protein